MQLGAFLDRDSFVQCRGMRGPKRLKVGEQLLKYFNVLSLTILFLAKPVTADESTTAQTVGAFTVFRAGGVSVFPSQGQRDPLSLDLHWTPFLRFEDLTARLDVGLSLVNLSGTNPFAIFGYEVFFAKNIDPSWAIEAGGGFQNWLENGGLTPVLSSFLLWSPTQELSLFQNIYLGLSKTFQDQASWQFRLGMALRIY